MVGDNKKTKLGRNRGIPKTQRVLASTNKKPYAYKHYIQNVKEHPILDEPFLTLCYLIKTFIFSNLSSNEAKAFIVNTLT